MSVPPATTGASDAGQEGARRERGAAVFSELLAVPQAQVEAAFAARVGAVFAEEQLQAAGGAAWFAPGLTARERTIAVVTALVAQGVAGDRLETHLQVGLRHGLDEEALTALMTLLAAYLGYPHASLAMEAVHAFFATTGRDDAS